MLSMLVIFGDAIAQSLIYNQAGKQLKSCPPTALCLWKFHTANSPHFFASSFFAKAVTSEATSASRLAQDASYLGLAP